MDIKKIFKGLEKAEAESIINNSSLTLEEYAIALNVFVDKKPRLFFCDENGYSLGKYHYTLNRVTVKIQSYLNFKLFAK